MERTIILAALSCAFALLLIVSEYRRPRRLLWKTLASAMFSAAAILFLAGGRAPFYENGIAWGLLFSMAGDVLLALFDNQGRWRWFALGVGAFSGAQICYACYFMGPGAGAGWGALLLTLAVFAVAMGGMCGLRLELSRMRFLVTVYSLLLAFSFAVSADGALAAGSGQAWLVAAGMGLFLLSDVALLLKYFLPGAPRWLTGVNLSLYYLGQALLTVGMAIGGNG